MDKKLSEELVNVAFTPEVWKTITIGGREKEELLSEVQKRASIHDWTLDAISQIFFVCQKEPQKFDLFLFTLRQAGFTERPLFNEMYGQVLSLGLNLCPIQTGMDLILECRDLPEGKIRVAMELVEDSDGSEHQFCVENIKDAISLNSNWIISSNRCDLDESWLFCCKHGLWKSSTTKA